MTKKTEKSISSFSKELSDLLPYLIRGMLRRYTDALGKGLITLPQFISLDLINSHGSMKMKDIAGELNISLPAATGMIDRLYHLGLVKREFDPKDRRIIKIIITPRGKKILESTKESRRKAIEEVFLGLSAKERESYLNIIKKVKNIMYKDDNKK